jgi:quaternary ammonium compound-resistance protein SugE
MAWIYLLISGVFEIGWAIGLKATNGFKNFWPICYTLATGTGSLYFLGLALRDLPAGSAYAAWTGIGAVGVVVISVIYFHEPVTPARLLCISLILFGVLGLKLTSG